MSYSTYNAYVRPVEKADSRDLDPVLVPDRFSGYAFLFGPVWALFHRLWVVAAVLALAYIFLLSPAAFNGAGIFVPGLALFMGLEGFQLMGWSLERRGYVPVAVIGGDDEEMAEIRFFQMLSDGQIRLPVLSGPVPGKHSSATAGDSESESGGSSESSAL